MDNFSFIIQIFAMVLEGIGVGIIILGTLFFLAQFFLFLLRFGSDNKKYTDLKHGLGRTILLGLEVLVAADIIATVITTPTLEQVTTLGIIVLIRTLLSFSLQVEIDGKLPWNKK